ncbi:hypothetical protein [Acinetobacter tianfuensis]|uniref:Uncharacterized protein n=1 Tax=Acinetobacter tianfuensis TaxID=2419603 RepID=A0A3A8EMU8_9GAMM|nr:hypothetical protein [Acinetobacter tianfuensis]RKG29693.1 hypothetical protein D7V32_14050 [Acinetobacter tianfuensis]
MRFIDTFNAAESERHISLDLYQPLELQIKALAHQIRLYEPEIIVASDAEADLVLAALPHLACCAAVLEQPLLRHVKPEQLQAQHHIHIRLRTPHPMFQLLAEKFFVIDTEDESLEYSVQHLLNTYMIEPFD